jgi:hypothetical protein
MSICIEQATTRGRKDAAEMCDGGRFSSSISSPIDREGKEKNDGKRRRHRPFDPRTVRGDRGLSRQRPRPHRANIERTVRARYPDMEPEEWEEAFGLAKRINTFLEPPTEEELAPRGG